MINIEKQIDEILNLNKKILDDVHKEYDKKDELTIEELADIADIITKLSKSYSSISFKQIEINNKMEIDFHNPKIQRAFLFIVQAFLEAMGDAGLSDEEIDEVMGELSNKLIGFEDKLNQTLKSVKSHLIERTINPLVKKTLKGEKND